MPVLAAILSETQLKAALEKREFVDGVGLWQDGSTINIFTTPLALNAVYFLLWDLLFCPGWQEPIPTNPQLQLNFRDL